MNTPSLSSMLPREMAELRSRPLFVFLLDVEKASIVGATPGCDRRVGVIAGGLRGRAFARQGCTAAATGRPFAPTAPGRSTCAA
jgi:hypothetical protein